MSSILWLDFQDLFTWNMSMTVDQFRPVISWNQYLPDLRCSLVWALWLEGGPFSTFETGGSGPEYDLAGIWVIRKTQIKPATSETTRAADTRRTVQFGPVRLLTDSNILETAPILTH